MSILHEFKTKDGRAVTVNRFQAKAATELTQQAINEGQKSGLKLISHMAASLTHIDGRQASMAEFRALPMKDGLSIVEKLNVGLKDIAVDKDGVTTANLPSGKTLSVKPSDYGTLLDAEDLHGEEMRFFSMIEMLCTIDGKSVDFVDAQLMDGLDYLAIQAYLNESNPS